jgi:PAS domain S-box-containing protein
MAGKSAPRGFSNLRKKSDKNEPMIAQTAELAGVNDALKEIIAGQKRAEQEIQLLLSIIQAVCDCEDFNSAVHATLRRVCETTGWHYAEAWIPSPDGKMVECSPVWYGAAPGLEKFRRESERIPFRKHEGLIGRVFMTKKPEWMQDVTTESEERFRRVELAKEAGLRAALAVPILAGNEVLAVLCFFMQEPRARDLRLVDIVSAVAMHLGSVIKHKQVDQALYESRELLRAIMDNSSRVIYLKDLEGRYLSINRQFEKLFHVDREKIKGRTDADLLPKDMADVFRANDRRVIRDKVPMEFEEVVRQDDGIHTYLSNKFPIFDAKGACYAVCGISTDITEQKRTAKQIERSRDQLEQEVRKRTAALAKTVKDLHDEIIERKQAEERLQESERRLATLMSNLPGMAYRCRNDENWTMEFISRGCFELTGYWPSELLYNRMVAFGQLIQPEDRKYVWQTVQEALREKRPFQLLYRIVTANGIEKWVWEQGRGVFDAGGNPEALEGFMADITEQRRAVEALRKSEERYRSLFETAGSIIVCMSPDRRILEFNAEAERVTGWRREEVLGKDCFPLFVPSTEWEVIAADMAKVLAGQPTRDLVNPIRTREGSERLVSWNVTRLLDNQNKPVGVIAIGRDITERKKAEAWLERMIETTQDAVISIDPEGRIMLFNPAAEKIFGYRRSDVEGKKVNMLMAEPYASQHDFYLDRYENDGEPRAIGRIRTVEGRRKNGEVFPVELSVTEVKTGDEARYAAFIRDISEKSRLQERLIESERLAAVGAASAAFAHEIGNPLNGMSMTVQLLERRLVRVEGVEETAVATLQNLKDEIRRLTGLLRDFSSFARRESCVLKPVSLATVAGEVFALEEESYSARHIEVEQRFAADLPLVLADRDKLKQAMLNLCKNAVEAMPKGGTLTVQACRASGEVLLEISDTGAGIPDGVDVFAPFATTKPTGTGLGLMVVRQIVSAHGGTISYTSEEGKGTTFRISLPVASA